MAQLKGQWWCLLVLVLLWPTLTPARQDSVVQAEPPLTQAQTNAEAVSTEPEGFALLDDLPTKNQIPFFENRFRIDLVKRFPMSHSDQYFVGKIRRRDSQERAF